MWFAMGETEEGQNAGGISRFDGDFFLTYTTADGPPSDRIRVLLWDEKGVLWIGTDVDFVATTAPFLSRLRSTMNR